MGLQGWLQALTSKKVHLAVGIRSCLPEHPYFLLRKTELIRASLLGWGESLGEGSRSTICHSWGADAALSPDLEPLQAS